MIDRSDSVDGRTRCTLALSKLVGTAPNFLQVIATLPKIAGNEATVLISGETGTGKELVARAVHELSDRSSFPFVCVNCASLPDLLIEDMLFGHEPGAFTDARTSRRGFLAEALGGTLLLDEVEALSGRAQAALLRVLQDGTFYPLGSAKQQRTNARIVGATNAPLEQMVHTGAFRSDLFHRLHVLRIDLPPLRERSGDVLLLAEHFLRQHSPDPVSPLQLDPYAKQILSAYAWPGNIRELENAILRAVVTRQGPAITADDLGISSGTAHVASDNGHSTTYRARKQEAIATFERSYLTDLIAQHGGNVTHAARTAGKDRRELGKLLKKHGVDPRAFRSPFAKCELSHPVLGSRNTHRRSIA
jgi:DNA-binding NtrC family response regulator